MTGPERLSVCYVAPGSHLVATAGPTRNVLSLARALSRRADVTVAFRSVQDLPAGAGIPVIEIDPGARPSVPGTDDSALRGVSYAEFTAYLRTLRRFVARELSSFDVVLEKSWLLSGFLSDQCRRHEIPAIPVENYVPIPGKGARRGAAAYLRQGIGRWLSGVYLRRAPGIIAETEPLRAAMVSRWRIPPDRIHVIGLGVDRELFCPMDQAAARRCLGIPADARVLLYVGVLDRAHDLRPVVDALEGAATPELEIHIVGDGVSKESLERHAAGTTRGRSVIFHGRVPHEDVPRFIAAADLCLAPYDPSAFPGGEVGYSTLKIREYLSAGRPVASVASGAIGELIREGVTGFLVDHSRSGWSRLLGSLPPRDRLREMGREAARTPLASWDDTARAYGVLLEQASSHRRGSRVRV